MSPHSQEVLAAIQHAELHLECSFTKEEFINGKVGGFIIPEDFDFEVTVRIIYSYTLACEVILNTDNVHF